jgi:hypothetical protein
MSELGRFARGSAGICKDVESPLIQPEAGRRNLGVEVRGDQDDPHTLPKALSSGSSHWRKLLTSPRVAKAGTMVFEFRS